MSVVELEFNVDDIVEITPEGQRLNGGKYLRGYIDYVKITRNQVLYSVLYNDTESGVLPKSILLHGFFLRKLTKN